MADLSTIKEEYQQFLKFIKEIPESMRNELSSLVYPFFVHIYVIFLKKKKNVEGQEFFSSYMDIFTNTEKFPDINILQGLQHIEEFRKHPHFKQFLESNYTVALSEESLYHLRIYFEEKECKTLHTIFRLSIFVNRNSSCSFPEVNIRNSNKIELSQINKMCKNFEENVLPPSTCVYKVVTHGMNLCAVDVNFKSTKLICGFENRAIHFWNLRSNFLKVEGHTSKELKYICLAADSKEEFLAYDEKKLSVPWSDKMLIGHTGAVYGVAIGPNNLLVSCSQDGTIRTWDLVNLKTVSIYGEISHPVWDVAVSPSGYYFASASNDARLWDFQCELPLMTFEEHCDEIDCIIFDRSSKFIATASADNTIKMWSIDEQQAVRTFFDNKIFQSSIAFSPDGSYLASADGTGCVKIFDVGSCQVLNEFQAHSSRILSMSYNEHGSLLATGGMDKYLNVWDIQCTQANTLPKLVASHCMGEVVHLAKFLEDELLVSVI